MTLAIIGQTLLLLAFVAAFGGSVAAFAGGRRIMRLDPERLSTPAADGSPTGDRLADGAWRAMVVLFVAALASCFLVLLALVGKDFTLAYVESRISRDLSLPFRLTALWSGQEGSLLLWLTVLTACGCGMVRSLRRAAVPAALLAFAMGVLLAIATFFAVLVAFVARPFAVVDQLQRDGSGMSPALQNYWMAIHPPTLYLGYVGVSVPFAIVMGALLARRRDDEWIATTRGWAIASWTFLTLGLVLGARWAYEEIGWGGYWALDPVENAALMPWLTATAMLHSIMVQQRRGMMRFWNAVLASLTFGLSIFGTFLTRSGVLSSVHSFVSSPVGWWFIGALAVLIAATLIILFRSRELLRAHHDVDSVVSREGLLLFNNLLLVSLALVVLWGVIYPILTAAVSDSRISLEKPWYDFFAAAFGLPLAGLLAFAPFIAWQGTPLRRALRSLLVPIIGMLALGVALVLAGLGSSPAGVAAVCLGVLVVLGVAADARRTFAARRSAYPDARISSTVAHVAVRHRRRWGAWIAHAGIAMVVVAVAGSAWVTEEHAELRAGDSVRVGDYRLDYRSVERERDGARMRTRAVLDVSRGGTDLGVLRAGRDFHPVSGEVSNEVGIRHDWRHMHDLFVTVDRLTEDGVVRFTAFVNPLVPLLWLSGLLMAVGATIAGWPARRSTTPLDRNDGDGVEASLDAVHELRNGTTAPRELLSGLRGSPRRPAP
ncbi:MAG: heme lyase CcmF/NrfE family subunit [Thermoleophilia bacterium]|nr:heme lyase CcmF/NrfE family subunit [Thermoleophilia bacterium]